jgi:DNA-binding GntR family transcriptional regulator
MLVEPSGMALAAQRAKAHHLSTLRAILKQAQRAIKNGDRSGYMELDLKFHDEIVSATDNAVLADVLRMLHQRASRIWNLQLWTDADLRVTQLEHEEIFEALKSGDADAASAAARAHLTSLRRRIMQGVV